MENCEHRLSHFSEGGNENSGPVHSKDQLANKGSLAGDIRECLRTLELKDMELARSLTNIEKLLTKLDTPVCATTVQNSTYTTSLTSAQEKETTNMSYETVIQWNLNGFWTRYEELKLLVNKWTPAVLCLQETHLRPNASANLSGYKAFFDSVHSRHAKHGTAVYVRNDIKAEEFLEGKSRENHNSCIHLCTTK
jgi:hypothetical protein